MEQRLSHLFCGVLLFYFGYATTAHLNTQAMVGSKGRSEVERLLWDALGHKPRGDVAADTDTGRGRRRRNKRLQAN